jgi:hypothetical protein
MGDHRDDTTGRVYIHQSCGGETTVSGRSFTHICDPFRPCTGTYCCTCAGYAPLDEVCWLDTGEPISEYRNRLRTMTPRLLSGWRQIGWLLAGASGAGIGALIGVVAQAPRDSLSGYA